MTNVGDIYNFIDSFAPFESAMSFDNVGLLVGDKKQNISTVILALDITEDVINEAKDKNAELIISHHPVIFNPIKNLSSGSIPYLLAKNNISAICAHTNLDMANGGVNTCLADCLGLTKLKPLNVYSERNYNKIVVFVPKKYGNAVRQAMTSNGAGKLGNYCDCTFSSTGTGRFTPLQGANPFVGNISQTEEVNEERIEVICPPSRTRDVIKAMIKAHPYEEPAFDIFETSAIREQNICGLVGSLEQEYNASEFAKLVEKSLNCNGVRYVNGDKPIKKVGLCSGSGGDLIFNAIELGVDAYVTGEIKHHELLAAKQHGITVVDAGHFCTEDIVIPNLRDRLKSKFGDVEFIKSEKLNDMFTYIRKE